MERNNSVSNDGRRGESKRSLSGDIAGLRWNKRMHTMCREWQIALKSSSYNIIILPSRRHKLLEWLIHSQHYTIMEFSWKNVGLSSRCFTPYRRGLAPSRSIQRKHVDETEKREQTREDINTQRDDESEHSLTIDITPDRSQWIKVKFLETRSMSSVVVWDCDFF